MYIMTPKLTSTVYFINPISVCICIPLSLLGNSSLKTLPLQPVYINNRKIIERFNFFIRAMSCQRKVDEQFFPELLVYFVPFSFFLSFSEMNQVGFEYLVLKCLMATSFLIGFCRKLFYEFITWTLHNVYYNLYQKHGEEIYFLY